MRLASKIAIITGAGSGIGEVTAKFFAREGANVILVGRNLDKLNRVASEIKASGKNAVAVRADISNEGEVQAVAEQAIRQFDKIDILINNAGTINDPTQFHEMSDKVWHEIIDTNLIGTFRMTRAVLPSMIERNSGSIVNIASISGMKATEKVPLSVYSTTKAGIIMFTKSIAVEYAPYKIRCNCVCPGTIRSPFLQPYLDDEKAKKVMSATQPLGRIGEPEDVAHSVLYLASDEASWVTGAVLVIDGGSTAR
ncbi:MAG: 3-oxoacyl-[acyl-carrier protein] reductase [Candidatus Nitrosomirales archaeon]